MLQEDVRQTEKQRGKGGGTLEWGPPSSPIGQRATLAGAGLALCSLAAWIHLLTQPVGTASIFAALAGLSTGALALCAAAVAAGYRSMRYGLDDTQLTISFLWMRETVPLGRVEGVYGGRRLGKVSRIDGLRLPGLYVGTAEGTELGSARFYATTRRLASTIVATTAQRAYAITPSDLEGFRSHFVARLEALSREDVAKAPEPSAEGLLAPLAPLAGDRVWLGLLAASALALLVSFAYVGIKMPELPASIPLHFNGAGQPDMIAPRADLLRIPIIGMLVLGVNGLLAAAAHAWQRDTSRLLAGGTLFVEMVVLLAALRVVH